MVAAEIALIARAFLAVLFILAGFGKLGNIAGTASYFENLGLPMGTLVAWGSGIFELAAGLFVLVGFQTRIAAAALSAFCIVAGYIGHYGQGGEDPIVTVLHTQAFMKDLGLAGGFALLALHGPGALSLDGRRA